MLSVPVLVYFSLVLWLQFVFITTFLYFWFYFANNMEDRIVKHKNAYDRVMPRVYNRSHPSNKATNTKVTRHDTSARIGAKASSSNLSSGVCMELPLVLTDYKSEAVKHSKPNIPKYVAKPRKTLKSLDPSKSPLAAEKNRQVYENSCKIRVRSSTPCVTNPENVGWSDAHVRQCYSSRSHTRLKELKDEIKSFQKTQKLMQLRSNLFKKCGVVLDDVGQVAEDKAVQVAEIDNASGDNSVSLLVCAVHATKAPSRINCFRRDALEFLRKDLKLK